ncbi:MAG: exodeoxyribonuclease VII large subunit [Hyphomicrobiales bacterium]|nr:exodeoxyribonuclease VII large subunit [Hyphomicrobiales bacterium]
MAEATSNIAEYSVSELSARLKRTVEENFGYVRVRGEISGYRGPHTSGHCYFALKDEAARIDAVIWRGVFQKLRFPPEEGMEVVASGRLTTYPNRSSYQIIIDSLEPAGVGALMALLEERKRKLAAEGLFDEARKRKLPYLPGVIGVVTSPTGAVIRDILHRLADRFPRRVVVWPVRVQGESSAAEVAAAIRGFNALEPGGRIPRPDVLIVARGGGSVEELWGFNEEIVVRAVADSTIPVIAAVGHETDWTLIDLVADVRAPTPTAAAEIAVPVRAELIAAVDDLARRMARAGLRYFSERRTALRGAARGLPRLSELLALPRQRFDMAAGRLTQSLRANTHTHGVRFARATARLAPAALSQRLSREGGRIAELGARAGRALPRQLKEQRRRLDAAVKLFASLGYENVLRRGFALVRDEARKVVRSAAAVAPGAELEIEFADGTIGATAHEAPGPGGGKRRLATRKPADPGPQGSLF